MVLYVIIGLAIYGLIVFYLSARDQKKITAANSSAEFAVAGRNAGAVALLCSVCLSAWSALSFYGYSASLYRDGIGYFSGIVGGYFIGLYAPSFMYRLWLLGKKQGLMSPGDYYMSRYGSRGYVAIVSVISIVCLVPYISVQLTGIASGIVTTTSGKISFWLIVGLTSAYMVFHVLKGGNKAVISSGAFAALVGLTICLCTTICLLSVSGGMKAGTQNIIAAGRYDTILTCSGPYSTWWGFLGLAVAAGMSVFAWPHIFAKSYMASSEKFFSVMATAFPLVELFAFGCFSIWGIWAGWSLYPGLTTGTDDIVPMMALNYAPAFLAVLLVIGVFAFGLSTADSQIVVATTIIERDIVGNYSKAELGSKFRVAVLLILTVCTLFVVKFRPEFLVTYAYSFCAPGFCQTVPALIGGLYWRKGTTKGAVAGTLSGMVAVIVTLFIYNPIPSVHCILWGLGINSVVYILVSLCTSNMAQTQKSVDEVMDFFEEHFRNRNGKTHNVLMALIALIFVQGIILTPYLPNPILFGWIPLQALNMVLCALETSVVGYFYARNRLYEPDGSVKELQLD